MGKPSSEKKKNIQRIFAQPQSEILFIIRVFYTDYFFSGSFSPA